MHHEAKLNTLRLEGRHCFQGPSCEHPDRIPRPLGTGTPGWLLEFLGGGSPLPMEWCRGWTILPVCLQPAHLGALRTQNCCLPLTRGPGPLAHSHALRWSGAVSVSPLSEQVDCVAGVPGRNGVQAWLCGPACHRPSWAGLTAYHLGHLLGFEKAKCPQKQN